MNDRVQPSFAAVALIVSAVASGCAESASPTSPSSTIRPADGTLGADQSAPPGASPTGSASTTGTGHPSPADLQDRGWTCFEPPIPDPPTVCSHPNQALPPADRPPTFTFWIFNQSGEFQGTRLLIREDLYHQQPCQSPDEKYFFVDLIGYYECLHSPGQ